MVMIRRGPASTALIRAAGLLLAAVFLGGCATYHQSHYIDSGAYYGSTGGYGAAAGYARSGYVVSNPVVYPYWSIDYFYFSRHYHPYSVYVGYHQPLYFPYPGWALGYYRPAHRWHSAGYGPGYPWYGFEHRYPRFSLGFFAGHDSYRGGYRHGGYRSGQHGGRRDHPIRHIDQRLAELQHPRAGIPRQSLLTRRDGGPAIRTGEAARSAASAASTRSGRREAARGQSRSQLLQVRGSDAVRADSAASRQARRGRTDPRDSSRSASRRDELRGARGEDRSARARSAQRGVPIGNLRGRVIVSDRENYRRDRSRRADQARRSERANTRSIGQSGARRSSAVSRARGAAESSSDAVRSRRSVIRGAQRVPDRASRSPRPDRPRSRPSNTPRAASPPPERAPRRASRRSSSSQDERSASRRDRLRTRSDGRRRR